MAHTGVNVKALESYPNLHEAQMFFLELHNICGANPPNIIAYCKLHDMTNEEIVEAIMIVNMIAAEVK